MYRLVAFDLDGTLLNENKTINKKTLKVIKKLQKRKVEIVIATGRGYRSAKNLIQDIEGDLVCIASNGAIVRNTREDKFIDSTTMDPRTVLEIIKIGDRLNLDPIIHVDRFDRGYDVIIRKNKDRPINSNRLASSALKTRELEEFNLNNLDNVLELAYFDSHRDVRKMNDLTKKVSRLDLNSHILTNVNNSEAILEYLPEGVSKWSSLKKYSNSIGVEVKEIITFGDDNNDRKMIEKSGLGIAMKNANKKIRTISDIITSEDNNGNGIYIELMKIFDLNK